MARWTFFSFHYQDVQRAQVVKQSWLTSPTRTAHGFWDGSLEEEEKTKGEAAIKRKIDDALIGTSVTVVLIGTETSNRKYVRYEIERSRLPGVNNGLVGIYIDQILGFDKRTCLRGRNPFDLFTEGGLPLARKFKTYDWVADRGIANIGDWVEEAARIVGR